MKYLIASDLHGSALYTEQLLARFREEQADKLILLGDLLYHGPRNDLPEGYAPKQVFAALNNYTERIICVRGNCDAEVDQMVLRFPILNDHRVLLLEDKPVLLTHGHHVYPGAPTSLPVEAVFFGHTHVPEDVTVHGVRYCNPGSVSIPKDGSVRGYLILEAPFLIWKGLDGKILKDTQW